MLRPELLGASDYGRLLESFRASHAAGEGSTLARLLQVNFETYLLDDLLVKMDRMSMAHGLEARSHFLDTALVEFGARIPAHKKLEGVERTKRLFRMAMEGVLPDVINHRKDKLGHSVPLKNWLRESNGTFN